MNSVARTALDGAIYTGRGLASLIPGLAYRAYHHIPSDFKLAHGLTAAPFQIAAFNAVNTAMQTYISGSAKYWVPAAPLLLMGARTIHRAWKASAPNTQPSQAPDKTRAKRFFTELRKEAGKLPLSRIGQAATVMPLAGLLSTTQPCWQPVFSALVGEDPSGHVLMLSASRFSVGLFLNAYEIHAGKVDGLERSVMSLWANGFIAAHEITLFNTVTSYHTVWESTAGGLLALVTERYNNFLWNDSSSAPDIMTVIGGLGMIAGSQGYNTAATALTMIQLPFRLACFKGLYGATKKAFGDSEHNGFTWVAEKISRFSLVALLGSTCINTAAVLAGAPEVVVKAIAASTNALTPDIASWRRYARGFVTVVEAGDEQTWDRKKAIHYGCRLGAIAAACAAAGVASPAISGLLWITHVGLDRVADRYDTKTSPPPPHPGNDNDEDDL